MNRKRRQIAWIASRKERESVQCRRKMQPKLNGTDCIRQRSESRVQLATGFAILLFPETVRSSCSFLKNSPPCTMSQCQ